MAKVTRCHWSPTGYAYETPQGACTCRIAAPPGVALYGGEFSALRHEREVIIARALDDDVRLAELEEEVPRDYERMLASANEKLSVQPAGEEGA